MIIAITGKKGSGKTTISDYLSDVHDFIDIAFADSLKDMLSDLFRIPIEHFYDEKLKEIPIPSLLDTQSNITPRQLMQVIGTELFREHLPKLLPDLNNIWIRLLKKKIKLHSEYRENFIIPDVRFDDEAQAVRDMGGIIIEVIRPNNKVNDTHKSESGLLSSPDIIIINDGTIKDLETKVYELIKLS